MEKINKFFKNSYSELILVSIMFLFFLELFSDFVECVYIFALMTLSLNLNVLAVLFILSSVLLLFFRKKVPDKVLLIVGGLLVISRLLEPLFDTKLRMLISGLGVGCFMFYFPAFLSRKRTNNEETTSYTLGLGLIIALSISILFRTLNSSVKTLFHYNEDSDRKQTATIEAEIVIGSRTFTIYITHTYGSTEAKSMLVNDVLDRAVVKKNVLFIGDMNFRQYTEPYNLITAVLVDAWLKMWPEAEDDNGLNASSRIDHIFVDPDLIIDSCEYIDWDEVESDHPAGTAVISW